jgi:5-methylcytosine-specific restriction endonuclease McrA
VLFVTANPLLFIDGGFFIVTSWRKEKATASQRGYTSRWTKARATYLASNPLCVMCQEDGRVTAATVVDHIVPHRGDQALFWDSKNNWQALCKKHHDSYKQKLEKSGLDNRCDIDGMPTSLGHHWHKG